ncbi:N-6 DNA methylase, partial [Lactococcus lactis]|uniref:N-6 DNA methylase n=1 Tax=Lactococcus lactis TaxID=1358 RepID=UPI0021AE88A7
VFSDETIKEVFEIVSENKEIKEMSKLVTLEDIRDNDYQLGISRYIDFSTSENKYRELDDIVDDLNRVIEKINAVKFTINENMAKSLGIHDLALMFKNGEKINKEMNSSLSKLDLKIKKESVVTLSRYKELKLEVKNFEEMPEFISIFFNMWKEYIMMMNNQENKLLIELRDTLLP